MQCRIAIIERAVRKLSGCIRQTENLHPSDPSDIDIMSDHFVTTNNIFIYIYLLYDFGSFFLQIHQRKTATYASTNL